MATYTSNYAWAKPSGSDPVDISVLNGNLDSQDGIIHDAFLNMAVPFSELSTYTVGNIVLYGTKTYRCRVAVTTAGSWTGATNWDEYKLSELTFDNTPTDGSNNPVKSDGIYDSEKDIYAVMGQMGAKNLNIFPYKNGGAGDVWSTNGIDFTVFADGSIDVNRASSSANPAFFRCGISTENFNPIYLSAGEKYILSGSASGVGVSLRDSTNTTVITSSSGEEELFNCSNSGNYYIIVSVAKDVSPVHTLVKPMLRLASDTDDTYQPYAKTNKQLTDEIDNKVDKVAGKGLSTNDYTNTDKAEVAKVANKADKTATASGETLALVPTSEGRALLHTAYGMSVQSGTPTPSSPVDIESAKADFRSVGKNLIPYPYANNSQTMSYVEFTVNDDGTIKANGTASADIYFYIHYRGNVLEESPCIIKNGTYVFSGCPTGASLTTFRIGLGRTHNGAYNSLGEDFGTGCTITLNGDDYSADRVHLAILISIKKNAVLNNVIFKPMLRLADVTDETYEPYTKHDTTTDLTLRAIEVTSSDAYNLIRDGKYYIADTLDYDEDDGFGVTRRVGEQIVDEITEIGSTPHYGRVLADENFKLDSQRLQTCNKSNSFVASTYNDFVANNNRFTATLQNNKWYWYFRDDSKESLQDWQTWIVSNPITIIGILATPTTEAITTAQALALLGLKTYDESTTISSQAEPSCTIAVEYAKERLGALALTAYNTAKGNDLRITALEG